MAGITNRPSAVRSLACTALVVLGWATPAVAQAGGRWAMLLSGGVRGLTRGELRLSQGSGSLWLESDSAPQPLASVTWLGDTAVRFTRIDGARLVFTGLRHGDVLRGTARPDSGLARLWTATRLQAETEYYPVLPQFTLRQLIVGRRDTLARVPGPWLAAARAVPDSFRAEYATLARAAGLATLDDPALAEQGPLRALGLSHRAELVAAARRTLATMRAQIPDAATRTRFDRIFRPRGAWIVDFHDAALALVQAASPGLTLQASVPALQAVGWLAPDSAVRPERVQAALYRLFGLEQSDSIQVRQLVDAMGRVDPASARAVELLLGAYQAASAWDADALRFLLTAPWIGDGGPRSIAARMQALWGDSLPMPDVRTRYFGYPQAVPRYGVPPVLFARLVTTDNWSADRWLERHHGGALLAALRQVPSGLPPEATLVTPGETLRLTTVGQESAVRDNGFLEPADAIAVDPGYTPVLALAAAVHEWQHLAFERLRREAGRDSGSTSVELHGADTYVTEGVAEWRTAQLMRPLAAAMPLLYAGEAEKHLRLSRDSLEPHVLGLRLVEALARALPEDSARLAVLLRASDDPTLTRQDPHLRSVWRPYASAPDLIYRDGGRRALIPAMTFTVEDGYPDLVSVQVDADAVGR